MDRKKQDATKRKWDRYIMMGIAILALMVLVACQAAPSSSLPGNGGDEILEASGIIQVEEVVVASEFGGRIAEIPVDEGDRVNESDLLVQLDTEMLDAQIEAVEATIVLVEAGLAQAQAGVRPGQIAVAEAQLAQAETGLAAARQAVSDTQALVDSPQDINLQIAVTAARVESARHSYEKAVALKDAIEIGKDKFEEARDAIFDAGGSGTHKAPIPGMPGVFFEYRIPTLPLSFHQMPNVWWQSWVGVNAANAQQQGLEASLAHLYAQRENPQAMEAAADEARAAVAQATAQVAAAQAQVAGMNAGATDEQIVALEARVAQAQAGRDALLEQREMMFLNAPMDGTVIDITVHPSEVAAQGATLLTIADVGEVILTVYVPETRIGQVQLGQPVQVTVDSFADRIFEGQVSHISNQAEFTPRNVATQEERVNLVFAVEIRISNDDDALKPGMPADAVFGE
ncbi:MAG: HlyD family efflux transporter periplasmic adaptor subunit [Chloroflexi bacterium]|nr:HlyD family efflux transporter periplasmic adaptor subunit [Chloroflexota bacterium]